MVRLLPETARRWVRSVVWNASSRSGGMRDVSPTTRPGNRARASGASPSVASRRPARSRAAAFWRPVGCTSTWGGPCRTRTTAAILSPSYVGGASRPVTRSRVDGRMPSQSGRTRSRTGVRTPVAVVLPRVTTTRVASPSTVTAGVARAAPRTRGRTARGSLVTVTSSVASAYAAASPGTGPRRPSAARSAPTTAPAAPHSSAAAVAVASAAPQRRVARRGRAGRERRRRRAGPSGRTGPSGGGGLAARGLPAGCAGRPVRAGSPAGVVRTRRTGSGRSACAASPGLVGRSGRARRRIGPCDDGDGPPGCADAFGCLRPS